MSAGKFVDGVQFDECTNECKQKMNCETCLQGKMSRMKFPRKSENRANERLQMIHSDVCGPMQTPSPSEKRYVLTFIDDFSRYSVIYLQEKSEVLEKFKEFVETCKTSFDAKPKRIRTDNGGEYVNRAFDEYLKQQGIEHQRTAPYGPQQNGVAERKNRTLVEMARCMIIEAQVEKKFWAEAMAMANYVQNRLPAKEIETTPLEGWHHAKPSIGHFKRFGSKCYVFVPDERRRKLDEKSVSAILVGYDVASKAYRCYVPSYGRVVISRDVKFVDKNCEWNAEEETATVIESEKSGANELLSESNERAKTEDDDAASNEANPNEDIITPPPIPVIRRSQRPNKGQPPVRFMHEVNMIGDKLPEPRTFNEAISSEQKDEWLRAMQEEIESLNDNDTWELVELPADRRAIGCKWVYKIKTKADGSVQQYKARLVAQGFSQKYGKDYDLVFAPVVRPVTFRILLVIAAKENMRVMHFDAKTAFLNGKLDEIIYMKQPPGFTITGLEQHVCFLRRSLYGLKQSARVWNRAIHQVLIDANYVQSHYDPCLYVMSDHGEFCYVLIYVDDLVVASKCDDMIARCENILGSKFEIKNLGEIQDYLGLRIKRNSDGGFAVDQSAYIMKVATDFGLASAKASSVPMNVSYEKGGESELLVNNEQYRQLIGCLLYISVNTRPDISASVSILAQKVSGPNQEDWNEVKRVVKYLKGTAQLSLMLDGSSADESLIGFADANWAESKADRKSNSGYAFRLYNGTISWSCKRQTCVALSSTKAEFIALSEACRHAKWIRNILMDFNFNMGKPTIIYEDNKAA